ncbi:MAG: helix-hairpin-helix domain-containing protein [Burkholderiaceae bacterium]|nr:helix-hairpin-helix domain-containing protein [Burkholderiaceae bacterium]
MSIRHFVAAALAALSLAATSAWAAIDANQASQAELETVKGIGPGLSGKIIAARQQAAFKDWADLVDRVGGVGPGNAARFSQAGLTVAGAPYAAQSNAEPAVKTSAARPPVQNKSAGKPTQP